MSKHILYMEPKFLNHYGKFHTKDISRKKAKKEVIDIEYPGWYIPITPTEKELFYDILEVLKKYLNDDSIRFVLHEMDDKWKKEFSLVRN